MGGRRSGGYLLGGPAVFAFWHERLPLMPALWTLALRERRGEAGRMHVLVSRHQDGRLIGEIMRGFGVDVVYGSSARRNVQRGGATSMRTLLGGAGRRGAGGDHAGRTARPTAAGRAGACATGGAGTAAGGAVRGADQPAARARDVGPHGAAAAVRARRAGVRRRRSRCRGDGWEAALPEIEAALNAAAEAADALCRHDRRRPGGLAPRPATPALRLMLRRRVARGKEDGARLPEREGIDPTPRPAGQLLWLHAASVGEAVSVLPVLSSWRGVTRR